MRQTLAVLALSTLFAASPTFAGGYRSAAPVAPSAELLSTTVAAGGAIDSGVFATARLSIITVYFSKGDATSRTATFSFYREDGTTLIGSWTPAACAATVCFYNVGTMATGATASTALTLPPKMKVVLASGGAQTDRMTIVVR
jgi:hypothetical protein